MAYSEVVGTGVINGSAFTRANPTMLIGTFDNSPQETTPIRLRPGEYVMINIDIASGTGTFQIQTSPIGQTTWAPSAYNGSNDISADATVLFVSPADCLLRVQSTADSSLAATVTIKR